LTHLLAVPEKGGIEDRTERIMVNLRRLIYLTINYEEAVHKLLKIQLKEAKKYSIVICLSSALLTGHSISN